MHFLRKAWNAWLIIKTFETLQFMSHLIYIKFVLFQMLHVLHILICHFGMFTSYQNTKQTREEVDLSIKGCWIFVGMIASFTLVGCYLKFLRNQRQKLVQLELQQQLSHSPPKSAGKWRKKFLIVFVVLGIFTSIWLLWYLNKKNILWREETLTNMCDERARMLQDQFNVSMNHVHALAILVSTFHHGKSPSAIDQVSIYISAFSGFHLENPH